MIEINDADVLEFKELQNGAIFLNLKVGNFLNRVTKQIFLYDTGATRTILNRHTLSYLGYEYTRLSEEDEQFLESCKTAKERDELFKQLWLYTQYKTGFGINSINPALFYEAPVGVSIGGNARMASGVTERIVPIILTSLKLGETELKYFPVLTYYKTRKEIQIEDALPQNERKMVNNILGTDITRFFQIYIDYDESRLVINKRNSYIRLLEESKKLDFYKETGIFDKVMISSVTNIINDNVHIMDSF